MFRPGRVMAILAAVILASLAVTATPAAPASAAFNSPGYEYRPHSFGGVVDLSCDGVHAFEMIVYSDVNYGGYKLKLCSVEDDLCDVHVVDTAIPNGCGGEFKGTTWHNRISSLKVLSHPTSLYNGGDWCLVLYDARYYNTQNPWPFGWGKKILFGAEYWPTLVTIGRSDSISSIKRTTDCGQ